MASLWRLLTWTTCRVCGYRGPRSQFRIIPALDIHRCDDMARCERNWRLRHG